MNRALPLLLLAIASASHLGCRRRPDVPVAWEDELERGYTEKNEKPLVAFLADWHKDSTPVSANLLARKPAFEQAVYHLYEAFFRPAEFYQDSPCVVIQDKVNVYLLDSDFRGLQNVDPWDREGFVNNLVQISQLEVRQFRPAVRFPGKQILYLQDEYLAPMLGFVTQENGYALLDRRFFREDCLADERQSRLDYLNSRLKIIPGHWGLGWHFESHPRIDSVYFAADLKQAFVSYREYYGGGEAIMKVRQNGRWEIVMKENTWVE